MSDTEIPGSGASALQVPLASAARAPKGNAPSSGQVGLEVISIIVLPLAVPNLALWLVRGEMSLLDLSFGFVALCAAVLTKSISAATPAWHMVAVIALVLTTVFVAVAIGTDSHRELSALIVLIQGDQQSIVRNSGEIVGTYAEIVSLRPSPLQWLGTALLGIILVVIAGFLILKREA